MPATDDELMTYVEWLADHWLEPHPLPVWADGDVLTVAELQQANRYLGYELGYRQMRAAAIKRRPANRRALALLRSLLSPRQQRQLRSCRYFDVIAPSGSCYRFYTRVGLVAELAQRGKRMYERRRFCLHGPDVKEIPPADTSLAQLLLLSRSEAEFLATAHPYRLGEEYLWVQEDRAPVPARAPL